MSTKLHAERKHSKFSASGAERWFNCPGSVELSEGLPDKDSVWSLEGTKAHEVLEATLLSMLKGGREFHFPPGTPADMGRHAFQAASFILGLAKKHPHSEVLVETRIHLPFIHPAMFGTFDGAVVDYFGTLHVFDYKYGITVVSPTKNLQMIFYALGLAWLYNWNFKKIRLWIIQPRVKGYDGPAFWDISIDELRAYVPQFKTAIKRVQREPQTYAEGDWCHWCKAKGICPLKQKVKLEKAIAVFTATPVEQRNLIRYESENV